MLGWIEEVNPSVICLQEVDYQLFESDLLPALQSLGYSGLSQRPKKMCKNQPCGCATFWRHDRFKLNKHCIKSRAMAVHLCDRTHQSQEVVVVNVHLEASQSAAAARNRARQINSPLRWAAEQATGVPILIAGDFNTGSDSALLQVLRSECWHGHDLAAAYEHPSASDTLPVCNASMASHDARLLIDHIFYSHTQFELECILEPFDDAEAKASFCHDPNRGLPDKICPSDHIPIAAEFRITSTSTTKRTPTNQVTADDVCQDRRAALEAHWLSMQADGPAKSRGKPSGEQLSALRAHAALVKGWMSTLSTAERTFVVSLKKKMRRNRATKTRVSRPAVRERAAPQKTVSVPPCQHVKVRKQHCWWDVMKKSPHQTVGCVLLAVSALLMFAYR